jgi:hypothetical protein
MSDQGQQSTRRVIWALVVALLAWGLYLAVGAFRFNHDIWRGVIVFGCMAAFLGFWLLMMKLKVKRDQRAMEFETRKYRDTEKKIGTADTRR